MPNRTDVLSRRAFDDLTPQFYKSLADIEGYTVTVDAETGRERKTWAVIPALSALPATVAPLVVIATQQVERETDVATWNKPAWQVSIAGYFPQITTDNRVVVDGKRLNIVGVEFDSHHKLTRLRAEEYVDGS